MKTMSTMCLALAVISGALFSNSTPAAELSQKQTDAARDAAWAPMGSALREKGRGAFPELAAFLTTNSSASLCYWPALREAYHLDGWDMQTAGDRAMLSVTHKILSTLLEQNKQYETCAALDGFIYLAQKGDATALPLMEKYLACPLTRTSEYLMTSGIGMPYRILQARVAGTNIVCGMFASNLYPYTANNLGDAYTTNRMRFIPSVANTGPQALYVYKAFGKAIMKNENYMDGFPESIVSNIPPEMLTMRVWFDKEGKAVTDVDISKYGVSVPGLSFATNASPNVRELKPVTEIVTDAKPPQAGSSRSWAFPVVVFSLSVIAIIFLYHKRRK